ncbi:MAG TPA: hypothetical protein VMU95_10705 [Trebonia sp.]|nr:hypothetical protein [Trebonia sp.]
MSEDRGPVPSVTCPVHPENNRIQRVSVVYAADAPPLLRPGPALRSASRIAWAGTGFGVAGAIALWIGALLGKGASGPALIAALVCFGYALALYGWAGARRARVMIISRGMPGALAVWGAAWYCDECDGVFFDSEVAPDADVVEGEIITPAAFHRVVWRAGRFGGVPGRMVG